MYRLRAKTITALPALPLLFCSIAHAQPDCESAIPIHTIQGASHVSDYVDQTIETCGVVTAVAFAGYYIQDATGDGNDATSEGIYVAQFDDKPSVGTAVRLSATVQERIGGGAATGNLSTTTLADAEVIESMAGAALPDPVIIGMAGRTPPNEIVISPAETINPINLQNASDASVTAFNPDVDAIDFYESLEGMRVSVADPVAVSAIRQFGNFSAEVFVLADNGQGVSPVNARTERGGIQLQPDRNNQGDQNPERVQIQFDGTLFGSTRYPEIKVGDTLETVTGVMGYSFGNFEVQAVGPVTVTPNTLDAEVTSIEAGETALTLASYNVLNLSGVDDDNDQRNLIAEQIVNNLKQPDIIALQEIQDNNGDIGDCPRSDASGCAGVLDAIVTLERLADAIVDAGGIEYRWFNVDPLLETNDDNRDEPDTFGGASLGNIRNAFLYNPSRVSLINFKGLTRDVLAERGSSVPTAFDTSRDPLEALFEFNGERITILNNHFTSRFGSTPIFGGPQPFVQAGEEARAAQSLAMHEMTGYLLQSDPNAHVVVLGDLNTFEFTDELAEVLPQANTDEAVLFNLIERANSAPYSFIFEGNSQALDHIFVTAPLLDSAEIDYINVNVDFPRLFSSTVGSDHEPVLARLLIGPSSDLSLGLEGTVYSESAIELFWTRNALIDRYDVYREGSLLQTTDGTSFFEDGLTQDTTYQYTIDGFSGDQLLVSESISVRTQAAGGPGVFNVRELAGSVYSSSAVEIFWTVSEFSAQPDGFDIFRNGELVGTNSGRSYFDDGLSPDTRYEYSVVAFLDNGDRSSQASIELTTRPAFDTSDVTFGPESVQSLEGSVYSSSALELFWEPAGTGSAAVAFEVLRDGEVVAQVSGTSYFDSELEAGTAYTYTVQGIDTRGSTGMPATLELRTREF